MKGASINVNDPGKLESQRDVDLSPLKSVIIQLDFLSKSV